MLTIPGTVIAGLPLRCSAVFAGISAPEWDVSLYLRGTGAVDCVGTPDGDGYVFDVDTSGLDPGTYWYSLRGSDGGAVVEFASGSLEVRPDLAAMDSYDGRSHCKKVLDAIEAVLEQRATHDQQSYTIQTSQGMRQLNRLPVDELLRLRKVFLLEYRRECAALSGRPLNRRMRVWM